MDLALHNPGNRLYPRMGSFAPSLRKSGMVSSGAATSTVCPPVYPAPVPVPPDLRAIPCLPPGWLERVGQYGLALEQFFFSLFNCSRYWFSW